MATPTDNQESLKQQRALLLGTEAYQLNLEAVRTRASELRQRIEEIKMGLQGRAAVLTFEEIIKEFSMVNVQFARLRREQRLQLRYYVAHPRELDPLAAQLVPEQLATMPLPEMAATQASILSAYPRPQASDASAVEALRKLQDVPEAHNASVDALLTESGVLHVRSKLRLSLKKAHADLAKTVEKKRSATLRVSKAGANAPKKCAASGHAKIMDAVKKGRL
eukprot:TRINITY_DN9240_c0_g1_i1.p1 TRINITY_DN9240_c0_g1~~TRINITY_DN9240_c0_g1_i1.p1  ORF type:complete len:222 (-),score=30.58 TRINITY_DN9240_c0_g1_i1:293-958(-)